MVKAKTFTVRKSSSSNATVSVAIQLRCSGWHSDSARIDATADITPDQARVLATDLVEAADRVDAKVAAKVAAETRRKAWRDREIGSGRSKVFGGFHG